MTKRIEILLTKYFSDHLTQDEVNELILWLERGRNKSIFNEYIALNFTIEQLKEERTKNDVIWHYIVSNYKKTPIRKLNYWRYKVAASVVILLGVSAFLYLNNNVNNTVDPIVVDVKVPGTVGEDRAILTLGDGTNIALEKGKGYSADNVESDGESIVYKDAESKAIAFNYLTVPRSGQFVIELSDQTKVWLNSESQLKYPKEFIEGKDREVELVYGEAYFDVSPSTNHNGTQFKVLTNRQEITVFGTEFNVKAYNDNTTMYTTLVEGKVSISNGKVDAILHPGEQAILTKEQSNMAVHSVNVYDEISWKEGIFSFEGKTLDEIMKVISRWYDVAIIFEDAKMKDIRFVGVFTKYQSLKKILENIKATNFINAYDIKDETIIIK
jgi:hypothetical protein